MERMEIGADIRSVSEDDDYFTLSGIANTPSVDSHDSIVEPAGAKFNLPLPLLLSHDSKKPVGEVTEVDVTEDRIRFTARIPKSSGSSTLMDRLMEAIDSVKHRLLRGVSISFTPLKPPDVVKNRLVYRSWRWNELSLVAIPSNKDAKIISFRADVGAAKGLRARNVEKGDHQMDIHEQLRELETERAQIRGEMQAFGNPAELDEEQVKEFDAVSTRFDEVNDKYQRVAKLVRAEESAEPIEAQPALSRNVTQARETRQSFARIEAPARKEAPGLMFARAMVAKFIAAESRTDLQRVVRERYGSGDIGAQVRDAVVGTTQSGNWATSLYQPNAAAVEFLEYLAPMTLIGKFGTNGIPALRRVDFNVPLVEQTVRATGYWVGEGAAKTASQLGFSADAVLEYEVASIVAISNRLKRRGNAANVEMLIRNDLIDALRERKDSTFASFDAAVSNQSPAGIFRGVTPIPSTANAYDTLAEGIRADLVALQQAQNALHYSLSGSVLLMSTSTAIVLSSLRNPLGAQEFPGINRGGGTIDGGIPVLTSDFMPQYSAGDVVALVHAPNIFLAEDGAESLLSEHATITLVQPAGDNAASHSLYQRNETGIRVSQPTGWAVRDGAVQVLSDVNWVPGSGT